MDSQFRNTNMPQGTANNGRPPQMDPARVTPNEMAYQSSPPWVGQNGYATIPNQDYQGPVTGTLITPNQNGGYAGSPRYQQQSGAMMPGGQQGYNTPPAQSPRKQRANRMGQPGQDVYASASGYQPPANAVAPRKATYPAAVGQPPSKRSKKILIFPALIMLIIVGTAGYLWKSGSLGSQNSSSSKTAGAGAAGGKDVDPAAPMDPVDPKTINNIDPAAFLSAWNFSDLAPVERNKFYQEKDLPNGTKQREYWMNASNKTITIAKDITYDAWSFNGQVPGPTLRATEGDTVIVHFINNGTEKHAIHFHGIHADSQDGALADQQLDPGKSTTYTFTAEPFGLMLYHCHTPPLAKHISKGLYGAFIIDPKVDTRPKPDKEMVFVMNGYDLKGNGDNVIYSVNGLAFGYMNNPIKIKAGELSRLYVVNVTEFDLINSFHLHGNFFWEYPTGTKQTPDNYTDTITIGEGQRSVLDMRIKSPGSFMFHAHQPKFSEGGWMGFFQAE